MRNVKSKVNVLLGIVVTIIFLYFALRRIDFDLMKKSLIDANYWLFIPSIVIIFISHLLRTFRWQLLLKPIKLVPVKHLFPALMIGYMGNFILPAHLGEIFRAYVIKKKDAIPASSVLATIVIERVIDVFSLVIIMAIIMVIYPFPDWINKSGYLLFVATIIFFLLLLLFKKYQDKMKRILCIVFRFLPEKHMNKLLSITDAFFIGIRGLKSRRDYMFVILHSILIWSCYWLTLHLNFYTFNIISTYHLGYIASLVVMVITTVGVVIPSSPGYIGSYHFLCQLSLEFFGVERTIGLAYAIYMHALNFILIFIVGLLLAWKEGVDLSKSSYFEKKINFEH